MHNELQFTSDRCDCPNSVRLLPDLATDAPVSGPERSYHGFVSGLMVNLSDRCTLTSNRESGFERYDVMLEPKDRENGAMISRRLRLLSTSTALVQSLEKKTVFTGLFLSGFFSIVFLDPKGHIPSDTCTSYD